MKIDTTAGSMVMEPGLTSYSSQNLAPLVYW